MIHEPFIGRYGARPHDDGREIPVSIDTPSTFGVGTAVSSGGRAAAIGQTLSEIPDKNALIFEREDNGRVLAAPWCRGFLTAMRLRWIAWQPLLDLNRIEHGLMLPILLHCTDETGRPMLGPPRVRPEAEEFLRDAYHDIPRVIPQIRETWMPQRLRER